MARARADKGFAAAGVSRSRRHISRVLAGILITLALVMTTLSWTAEQARSEDLNRAVLVLGVSGARMMDTIQDLQDIGSRDFHLNTSHEAASYIHEEFEQLGLEVVDQEFAVGAVNCVNVVATLPGSDGKNGELLFGAHYDSQNSAAFNLSGAMSLPAPGADDDASGVAAVVEIARAFAGLSLDRTVVFVAFGAEEYGYDHTGGRAGSSHFALEEKSANVTFAATAIFDMIGYRANGTNVMEMVLNDAQSSLASSVNRSVDLFDINVTLESLVNENLGYSDHKSFWNLKYPSVLIVEQLSALNNLPLNPNYHTAMDTKDTLSESQIENITKAVLGGALQMVGPPGARTSVWAIVVPIMIIVAAVAIILVIWNMREKTT